MPLGKHAKRKSCLDTTSTSTPRKKHSNTLLLEAQSPAKQSKIEKNYDNNEIVATLMEEQEEALGKGACGQEIMCRWFKCLNPRCKGKLAKQLPKKGVQSCIAHLKSRSCYGASGVDVQVSAGYDLCIGQLGT